MDKLTQKQISILKISATMVIACALMYIVEEAIQPSYLIKTLIKLVLFIGLPWFVYRSDHIIHFKDCWKLWSAKQIFWSIGIGMIVYGFIVGGYFLIASHIDLQQIQMQLSGSLQITKKNFMLIATYIALANSLIEEFFFRGFGYLSLKRVIHSKIATVFSSLLFAAYHVSIMSSWFSMGIFLLFIFGLFLSGLLFNWFNEKYQNIYGSWIIHMFANFALNTIGFILFGII